MKARLAHFQRILMTTYIGTVVLAGNALADCGNACKLDNPNSLGIPQITVASAVKDIIDLMSFIAAILSVFFIISAGIRYAGSSGNKQRTEGAKQTLTYAVIGLIISVLAFSIVGFITAKAP